MTLVKFLVKRNENGEIIDKIPCKKGRPPLGYKVEEIEEIEKAEEVKEQEQPEDVLVIESKTQIDLKTFLNIFSSHVKIIVRENIVTAMYCDLVSIRYFPKEMDGVPYFKPNMVLGKVVIDGDSVGIWKLDAQKEHPDIVIKKLIYNKGTK